MEKKPDLMKTDKLAKMREQKPIEPLKIPEEELCRRFKALYTGAINDVLREMCLVDQALPPEIHPLRDEMKVCGAAYTIKSARELVLSGEMRTRAQMLDEMPQNCVCVWESGLDCDLAHWGEVMTAASKARGAVGAVIDGGIRDTAQILNLGFPLFYKYRSSNGSLSRCRIIAYNVPVVIGRVFIYPGDIVFGDIDGVVIVPRNVACDVLLRAEEIRDNEKGIRQWVDSGQTAVEIIDQGGYF